MMGATRLTLFGRKAERRPERLHTEMNFNLNNESVEMEIEF